MRFAVREPMATGSNLLEKFTFLATVGIAGIEITQSSAREHFEEIRRAAAETGVAPVICSVRGGAPLDARRSEREAYHTALLQALDLAADLGSRGVIMVPTAAVRSPDRPRLPDLWPLMSAADAERQMLQALLREVGPYAAQRGVTIIIEPLNRYEQRWPNTIAQGAAICRDAGPGVATMADFFHMNIEESDIATAIAADAQYVRHVHLADNTRGLPGTGALRFGPGLRALREAGYDGFYGFECRVTGDPAEALRRAMAYVQEQAVMG